MSVQIYTADQAAQLLGCSVKTVEELARQGELPGIKPGGGWVFPAGALAQRLDQLALERLASTGPPCGLRCKRQFGFTGCQKPQH